MAGCTDLDWLGHARLPSPAPVVMTLFERIEHGSAESIAQVIETDPAMSARLLRLANSAFFGSSGVGSVQDAVVRVGTVDVAALVLASEVMQLFRGIPLERWNLQRFWDHSLLTACFAQVLAPRATTPAQSVWLCGLLHDIGKLALVRHCPDEYAQVLALDERGVALLDAERAVFGQTHAAVGEALLRTWRLPDELAICAACHHDGYARLDTPWAVVAAANDWANGQGEVADQQALAADEIAQRQQEAGALYDAYRQLFREHLR